MGYAIGDVMLLGIGILIVLAIAATLIGSPC